MTNVEQIFQAIQLLPVQERRQLVDRIVHELADTPPMRSEPRPPEEAPSLLGLFADEPDLVDEVCSMAMESRKRDPLRTGNGDHESDP
jgi:hypothetical protein